MDRTRKLLIIAMLVDTLGGGLLTPFWLVYALKVADLPLTTAGLVLTIAAAAGITLGPIAGAASDRFGPARVVAVANLLGIAGCVSLLAWENGWGYGLGAFLLSANMRVFWAAFMPLVTSIARAEELERWFGRIRGARYIGVVSGQALSGLVFLAGIHTGLRLLVVANALSFAAALALVLIANPPHRATGRTDGAKRPGGYRSVLSDRLNLVVAGLNVAATLLIIAPVLALPVYVLEHLRLPIWLPGVLAATLTATAAGGLLFGARLVQGRRRLRNLGIAAVLWSVGCAAFLLASQGQVIAYAALFVGVLLLGLGEAMYAPTADALPAAFAPLELRGRYAAVHQSAWGISETIAPTLAAAALTVGGPALWLTLAGLAAATAGAYHTLEGPAKGRDGVAGAELAPARSGPAD